MTNSYDLAGVTFNGTAGGFSVTNSGSVTLTMTGGVTNNVYELESLNVPIALDAPTVLVEDQNSAGLTLGGVISGSASYSLETDVGNVTLGGSNTFAGPIIIGSGELTIGASGILGGASGTNYGGAITNNGALPTTALSPRLGRNWAGGLTVNAGTLTLGNGTQPGETYTGATVVNGGRLNLYFGNVGNSGIYLSSSLTRWGHR